MESHVLNTYHQARYRIHGLNRTSTSESYSSESSCNQNSPEYPEKLGELGEEWKGEAGSTNVTCKVEEDTSESSSDYDEVPESVLPKQEPTEGYDQAQSSELADDAYYPDEMMCGDSDDDYEIVVEAQSPNGPIIQVYAVDPNLDLEVSEDEQDFASQHILVEGEDDFFLTGSQGNHVRERHDSLGINLDEPVVTNVDEYFIKETKDKEILEVKDQSVDQEVDKYFIKHKPLEQIPEFPNVEDFFIKNPKVEREHVNLDLVETLPDVEEFFNKVVEQPQQKSQISEAKPEPTSNAAKNADILPHIEHIKRFLLEDVQCPKLHNKSTQRSCSLPHSPAHFSYLDADDAKTSVSFEDLNLDLSDFMFDEGKTLKNIELPMVEDANASDDNPRTLTEEDVNGFLITSKPASEVTERPTDDLSQEDMEIEAPVESNIDTSLTVFDNPVFNEKPPSKASTVLDFCIEKPANEVKVKKIEPKVEVDDFVDVESLNDTVIPVLEATNVSALLEQFEATEKFNTNVKKKVPIKIETPGKVKAGNGLPSGVRLQDAAAQLNKNKMRHILMSTTTSSSSVKKSSQPVHSDHDYCSPKKRQSLSASLKSGQSLLKPEVLSSNSKILSSRHRSCKSKNVVYHLSSDDEDSSSAAKNKNRVKPSVKASNLSNHRKKLSPVIPNVANVSCKEKGNVSVMSKNASKASDNCSQSSSGSIKLTIKNKSKVILKIDCDDKKDSQKVIKNNESVKDSVSKDLYVDNKPAKQESNAKLIVNDEKIETIKVKVENIVVKEETRPLKEDFYTALFKNKQDIHIALPETVIVKTENKIVDSNENKPPNGLTATPKVEVKPLKKKLNLQEYKLRREGVNSNGSSRTVSPEAIFPDLHIPINFEKTTNELQSQMAPIEAVAANIKPEAGAPKLFDPIRDASRKILANTKKQKAEATRKRDEDIVMSKIPKVENLQLQPLISDAEMLKIVGMAGANIAPLVEKPKVKSDYVEIVLVSVGTNTDEGVFKKLNKHTEKRKSHSQSPTDDKPNNDKLINFRIKKSENVLKQNVFEPVKNDAKSPNENRNISPNKKAKIDEERYKDITATLKSVGKHVDKKICSNSLFASIQDVVMKKAPDQEGKKPEQRNSTRKSSSPVEKKSFFKPNTIKTAIVREYDSKSEHGEDKIILHLEKNRSKPVVSNIDIQTDPIVEKEVLPALEPKPQDGKIRPPKCIRKRTVSDMSVSSEESPIRPPKDKTEEKKIGKRRSEERMKRSRSRDRRTRSRSKSRYRPKYSRRNPKRTSSRSRSRCRSRSVERYRYRRSHTPHRRSPYRSSRSRRRDFRHRSRSRNYRSRTRSPIAKKGKITPETDKKELTARKPTVSESSESSSSSSSSSSSGTSGFSSRSRTSARSSRTPARSSRTPARSSRTPARSSRTPARSSRTPPSNGSGSRSRSRKRSGSPPAARRGYTAYGEETRDSTPVEERRIVFVGKLEKEVAKSSLRAMFIKFGPILEVTLHSKEDGCRYGFVTFQRARDAWSAVEAAASFPNYDVGFGGRRAFCRQRYADLDGLEADYSEGYLGPPPAPAHHDMSFEQMLLEMKHKLSQRKTEKREEKL